MSNADQNPDEVKAREIIYKDNFFKQYADIVPEVGEKLERYVFDVRDALSSLRAEGDERNSFLIKQLRDQSSVYKTLEAEKKSLEDKLAEAVSALKKIGKECSQYPMISPTRILEIAKAFLNSINGQGGEKMITGHFKDVNPGGEKDA